MSAPIPRVGGRLLLLDPQDRVLLIHERLESGGSHWLTPGGGLEDGETPLQAAVREAFEETGIAVDLPAGAQPVLTTRRLWSWQGTVYDQVDHFYLARLASAVEPAPRSLTEPERITLLGHRWWRAEELRATAAVLLPPDLGDVLTGLLGA
jgi:8-oxo-dGTP pyrophosphatase MutT (NUDIX family)